MTVLALSVAALMSDSPSLAMDRVRKLCGGCKSNTVPAAKGAQTEVPRLRDYITAELKRDYVTAELKEQEPEKGAQPGCCGTRRARNKSSNVSVPKALQTDAQPAVVVASASSAPVAVAKVKDAKKKWYSLGKSVIQVNNVPVAKGPEVKASEPEVKPATSSSNESESKDNELEKASTLNENIELIAKNVVAMHLLNEAQVAQSQESENPEHKKLLDNMNTLKAYAQTIKACQETLGDLRSKLDEQIASVQEQQKINNVLQEEAEIRLKSFDVIKRLDQIQANLASRGTKIAVTSGDACTGTVACQNKE